MKSRLLPPPVDDRELDRDSDTDAPAAEYTRRADDDFFDELESSENDATTAATSPAPAAESTSPAPRPAPEVSARPTGRYVVVAVLLTCVLSVGYALWSTFLRDAAYGVVVGKVTALSPPWAGTLTGVYVRAGDQVEQGDVLAVLEDPELQASIDQLSDDFRAAQAALDAQVALMALAARDRGNATEEIRADYYDLRGELLAEQSRHEEVSSKLERRQALAGGRGVSEEEIASLRFAKQGLAAKIENLTEAVAALETRLAQTTGASYDSAQLKPQLAAIENYQAAIRRLREKQHRGTLRAPMAGTVVAVAGHVGERTTVEQPVLEILPTDAVEIVLYVAQNDAAHYVVGTELEVVVEPLAEPIACRVTRIGQRLEKPQTHVPGRYRPESKMLPVVLTPTEAFAAAGTLPLGSTVRQPARLFGN